METWMIVAIVAAIAIVLYFVMRRKTLPAPVVLDPMPIRPAPGVLQATGTVPPNPPPPPPPDVQAPIRRQSFPSFLSPVQQMQNVPVLGGAFTRVDSLAKTATFAVTDKVNNSIAHIPIAGAALAAPGKAIASGLKSISSWF